MNDELKNKEIKKNKKKKNKKIKLNKKGKERKECCLREKVKRAN